MEKCQQEKVCSKFSSPAGFFCSCLFFFSKKIKGFNGACSVHEYAGTFKGEKVNFKMTAVCGHVLGLDFLGKP